MTTKTSNAKEATMKTRKISWVAGTGQAVEVTVSLVAPLDLQGNRQVGSLLREIDHAVTVDGKSLSACGGIQDTDGGPAVARIGKVGITAANLARIQDAEIRLQTTPEWALSNARRDGIARDRAVYAKATARIVNAQ